MSDDDDPSVDELRRRQLAQEQAARRALEDSDSDQEAQTNLRRADKAHYLSEKLKAQERADREE